VGNIEHRADSTLNDVGQATVIAGKPVIRVGKATFFL
jgi:hypothetical protein